MKKHKQKHIVPKGKIIHLPYSQSTIIILSLTMSIILTGVMILSNIYNPHQIIQYWPHILLNLGLNIGLFYLLFLYNFTISKKGWIEHKQYIWGVIGTMIITVIYMRMAMAVRTWTSSEEASQHMENIHLIKEAVMAITVLLICFLFYNVSKKQQILTENQQLQTENILIRYDALKTKLDPHFLFNSLNTLSSIVDENPQAQHYIEQLADIYRYIIQKRQLVTLADEIKFTESYLYLLQIRFSNNIKIQWDVNQNLLQWWVVPISVQLLVENAIKHNMINNQKPLEINIFTTKQNSIIVENKIQPKIDETTGMGIGLNNLNERYKLLLGTPITIIDTDAIFSVEFPLISNEDKKHLAKNFDI